jgi:hypothetical protein
VHAKHCFSFLLKLAKRYRKLASNINMSQCGDVSVKGGGGGRLWVLLQHLDHHALRIDFGDRCDHVTKALKTPLVGSDSYVHSARFAILWRLKHSVALDSQGRQIYDEVFFYNT